LTVLEFNYLTIQLNQLNWRDFLKRKNPVAAALMSKMKIDSADRPKVKLECLRAIVTLKLDPARTSLLSWFIDSYLTLNPVEALEFQEKIDKIKPQQQKEQVMQMVTSWTEEGEQRAFLKMVRQVLLRRVGAIDPEVDRQLQSLSVEQLEALHDAALDFTTPSDLLNWLN
jgi:Domain of unknown function (DUF4351)